MPAERLGEFPPCGPKLRRCAFVVRRAGQDVGVKAAGDAAVSQVGKRLAKIRRRIAEPAFGKESRELVVRISIVVPKEALVALVGMAEGSGGSSEEVIFLRPMLRSTGIRERHRHVQ